MRIWFQIIARRSPKIISQTQNCCLILAINMFCVCLVGQNTKSLYLYSYSRAAAAKPWIDWFGHKKKRVQLYRQLLRVWELEHCGGCWPPFRCRSVLWNHMRLCVVLRVHRCRCCLLNIYASETICGKSISVSMRGHKIAVSCRQTSRRVLLAVGCADDGRQQQNSAQHNITQT